MLIQNTVPIILWGLNKGEYMTELSIYSNYTDAELEEEHSRLTYKYGEDIKKALKQNEIIISFEKKKNYLTEYNKILSLSLAEQEALRHFILEYLYRHLKESALMTFLAMEKRNDYGPMGQQRVTISFCRCIMNIPNKQEVTQFDVDYLNLILKNCDERNGKKSGDEYIETLKNKSFNVFSITYPYHNLADINIMLDLIKADYYLFVVHKAPYGFHCILGPIEKKTINENKIIIMSKEYIRFPQWVLSIAAQLYKDTTIIRRDSIEVIFFNKWQKYFDMSNEEHKYELYDINTAICESLKAKTLNYYNGFKEKDVLRIKDIFMEDILDGIVWHEIGHHVSKAELDPVYNAFSFCFNCDGGSAVLTLNEALADWAPKRENKQGAFSRFLELSKSDINKATRNIYTYMSDSWFVDDEEEDFLALLSYILVGLTIYFINNDGKVNFDKISLEKDDIYKLLLKNYLRILDRLMNTIYKSYYYIGGKILNYFNIELELYEMYKNTRNARSIRKLKELESFWVNIQGYLHQYSKEGWTQYENVLKDETIMLEKVVLNKVSNGKEEKYNYSLKKYIIKRVKEIGIINSNLK